MTDVYSEWEILRDGFTGGIVRNEWGAYREEFSFAVYGRPIPKGRPRLGKHGLTFTPKRTREAENMLTFAFTQLYPNREPISKAYPVGLSIVFGVRSDTIYAGRADLSNLVKLVEDALNGVAWEDDCQIVSYIGPFGKRAVQAGQREFTAIRVYRFVGACLE